MKTAAKLLAYGALIAAVGLAGVVTARAADLHLLNVSYDPTRELYEQYNQLFADYWNKKTGDTVTIDQSHDAVPVARVSIASHPVPVNSGLGRGLRAC